KLGRMRCLQALGDWDKLLSLSYSLYKEIHHHRHGHGHGHGHGISQGQGQINMYGVGYGGNNNNININTNTNNNHNLVNNDDDYYNSIIKQLAPLGASAAFHLNNYDLLS